MSALVSSRTNASAGTPAVEAASLRIVNRTRIEFAASLPPLNATALPDWDHVGTGLEYHPEHPDGTADLVQREAVVQVECGHLLSDGIRKAYDVVDACYHPVDLGSIDLQPLVHRPGYLAAVEHRLRGLQVPGVGLQYLLARRIQSLRHGAQRPVLDLRGQHGQFYRCGFGPLDIRDDVRHCTDP